MPEGIRVEAGRERLQERPLQKLGEDAEPGVHAKGERLIWVEAAVVDPHRS